MKKTLLATAIAGAAAFTAAGAQAATVYNQDGTKLDIYGNVQIVYAGVKDEDGHSRDEIADNGSTFGFAAEHVIYNGLIGYAKIEIDDFKADEMKVAGRDAGDTAYIGLKGNFGDARIGSYDSLLDDWIQDPISNNEYFDVSDSNTFKGAPGEDADDASVVAGDPEGDKITYTSPVWGGFQFALGTQYKGDAENENLTDGGEASIFGGLKYTIGGFSVAGVYDDLGIYDIEDQSVSYLSTDVAADGTVTTTQNNVTIDDEDLGDQYGVTMQYQWDSLRVAVKYERFESDNDFLKDADYYAIGARYGYLNGMGDIYGSYQYIDLGGSGFSDFDSANDDENDDDNFNEVVAGVTYNISDAMYTYVEGAVRDRDNDQGDGYAVGLTYLF
ncbi:MULTISPECIES: porin [unclassified Halomonas]|uniref:porin n=1 Tax=unclassified Halomonas TaxID=2609666 RepID=UPI0005F9D1E7|nr:MULTISPECIES: porin [unclassified Halomonas]MBR9772040.1 porin [Gammaproteobacteria bacterium]MBS8267897.1 porin [Halomonas litopenaei]KJZ07778.1 porin [Halomonas sp. S2151]MCJ8283989.1 porin [Halomonas sp.]MCO7217698.1 porin [Halomonas sp. OfavH-34-E]